jgi:HemY protein
MIRLFIFSFLLTLASIAAMWFIDNDGSVTVQWLGYRIQTSVAFTILAGVIVLIIVTTVIQTLLWIKNFPGKFKRKISEKRREQGLSALTEGFAAIAAGDTKEARRLTKQATNYLGNIPLTKLLNAQAAQLEGNNDLAKVHYTAMLENKETEIIAVKGLLVQAKQDGDLEKAVFLAEKAIALQPDATWAITMLLDLYKMTGRWADADRIMPNIAKLKIMDSVEYKRSISLIWLAKCHQYLSKNRTEEALKAAKNAYKLLPLFAPVTNNYAKMLMLEGKSLRAAHILKKSWKAEPHMETADLYMEIYSGESDEKRIKRAEKLLALKPDSIEGHMVVAKAAMILHEFDIARTHLNQALSIRQTQGLCKAMADLEYNNGANKDVVRQWTQRAETSHPDPVWSCASCGFTTNVWDINCKKCHGFDKLVWGENQNEAIRIITPGGV